MRGIQLKLKHITIPIQPFGTTVHVLIGPADKATRIADKIHPGIEPITPEHLGKHYGLPGGNSIIWLPHLTKSPGDISSLAHEVAHAAVHLFYTISHDLSPGTDEPFAYTIDYIIEQALSK